MGPLAIVGPGQRAASIAQEALLSGTAEPT
jgi:hypothetical protein